MRRFTGLLLAAGLSLAATVPASADTYTTFRKGAWENFAGSSEDGTPVCGAGNYGQTQSLIIKYFLGAQYLSIHLFADHWRIPEGVEARVELQVDNEAPWSATAMGFGNSEISGLGFTINIDDVDVFMEEIAQGDEVYVHFLDGDEGSWSGGLYGSAASMAKLKECIINVIETNGGGTQPFNAPRTQPYSAPSTQPFAPKAKTPVPAPTERPLVNTMPVFGA